MHKLSPHEMKLGLDPGSQLVSGNAYTNAQASNKPRSELKLTAGTMSYVSAAMQLSPRQPENRLRLSVKH